MSFAGDQTQSASGPTWSWGRFEADEPVLGELGRSAFAEDRGPSFLATVRNDALPRVHPVTPLFTSSHLILYMYPTSPKGHDLQQDGRFAMHSPVTDHDGTGGEFTIRGLGRLLENSDLAETVSQQGYPFKTGYVRYELSVLTAIAVVYTADGGRDIRRWRAPDRHHR